MATITGLTAARMFEIEAASVVGGHMDMDGHLILEKFDTTEIDAGLVGNFSSKTSIVVAASDASEEWEAVANFVCDGTADDVQIQLAIAEGLATGTPVLLSPGNFWLSDSVESENPIHLRGCGMDKTWLKIADGMDDYAIRFTNETGDGTVSAHLSHFTIDGRCAEQTAGGGIYAMGAVECFFENIHFVNSYNWGLVLAGMFSGGAFGHNNRVRDCHFNATVTSAGYGGALDMTSNDENDIRDCTFQFLGGDTAPVSSNPVAVLDRASINSIIGCTFVGSQGATDCIHIRLHDTKGTKIIGCMFDGSGGDAIFATGGGHTIMGNVIVSPGDQADVAGTYSGIHLEYASRGITVVGNQLRTSGTAGNTRSLIRLRGDGDAGGNIIVGNSMIQEGAGTPGTDFFELGGVDNIIEMNLINVGLVVTPYPVFGTMQYNGSAYVKAVGAQTYTGTATPATAANGSVWFDRTASLVKIREAGAWVTL